MAVSCDLRIMARSARIGVPVARTLGNCLSIRNAQRLVNLIGPSNTKRLIFGAMLVPADQAVAWGLANEAVDDGSFAEHIRDEAERMAGYAPITLRVTKEQARRIAAGARVPEDAADDLIVKAYTSEDFHEGVAAFLAKRPPGWTGR
jgi:enoyl-CoA hydratase